MSGHDWQPAQATIVDVHIKSASGDTATREFLADVQPVDGAPFRATIQEPNLAIDFWAPERGDVVKVLIDPQLPEGQVRQERPDRRAAEVTAFGHRRPAGRRGESAVLAPRAAMLVRPPTLSTLSAMRSGNRGCPHGGQRRAAAMSASRRAVCAMISG